MKTMVRNRLVRVASLAVLTLLALAAGAQAALASAVEGTGGSVAAASTASQPVASSSSVMSATDWIIVAAVVAGLLIIGEWAVLRGVERRRERAIATSDASAMGTFCTQNPESALCRA
jgi:hypothetical protein